MDKQKARTVEVKLRAVAAEAESLADDLRDGRLWEGECSHRIGGISSNLTAAWHLSSE